MNTMPTMTCFNCGHDRLLVNIEELKEKTNLYLLEVCSNPECDYIDYMTKSYHKWCEEIAKEEEKRSKKQYKYEYDVELKFALDNNVESYLYYEGVYVVPDYDYGVYNVKVRTNLSRDELEQIDDIKMVK